MKHPTSRGFTLIELLITIAVIGLLAAIAIPNLLNAINHGKQKRTMADIKTLAAAVEVYSVDQTFYPAVSNVTQLAGVLEPVYLRTFDYSDGWNHDFIVAGSTTSYTIASGGKDGGGLNVIGGATSNFNDAIIFTNGTFSQWPEGGQQ